MYVDGEWMGVCVCVWASVSVRENYHIISRLETYFITSYRITVSRKEKWENREKKRKKDRVKYRKRDRKKEKVKRYVSKERKKRTEGRIGVEKEFDLEQRKSST
jgi:hypothetical protein